MSFFFKSKQKANPLPPASRDIRSSDGPPSQIPTINGMASPPKPSSPTAGSINNSISSLAGNDLSLRSGSRGVDEKGPFIGPDGGRSSIPPSPEQKTLRDRNQEPPRSQQQQQPAPARTMVHAPRQPPSSQDTHPYPWSSRQLTFTAPQSNPFPRYGAAVNATASKDGAVYLMGGLINGSTVKGDLWIVEPSSSGLSCFPVATTSEGPGPRVGHASLLVGNAFIVFGGDTKMDEGDMLDDTLYLLNTSTKQWSRALPAGPRPPGRYGHTLNILGSKIYIFGGQVEGYFFNDLYAFDLNALQQASNKWELLVQNTIDGGPPHGQIPPARTNHTMITWGDKLYLFGGTDGVHWFNDVWSYSPHTNSWTALECIGYIPAPREGHAAALVGDVMYIFGGRTEEGNDLGDLAAFRISSRRWYTFQNMGDGPSPRSGHSMTTVGKQIVVLAGEPSSAPRDPIELAYAYYLDTSKIRYPPDAATQGPPGERARRPSGDRNALPIGAGRGQPALRDRDQLGSTDSLRARHDSRLPQATRASPQQQYPAPSAPPPAAPSAQPRVNGLGVASRQPTRALSPASETDRAQSFERNAMSASPSNNTMRAPPETAIPSSPSFAPGMSFYSGEQVGDPSQKQKVETYQPSQDMDGLAHNSSATELPGPIEEEEEDAEEDREVHEQAPSRLPEQMPKVRALHGDDERPQDSGIGSSPALSQQYDDLIKELEQAKQRNAWYASELALARKSGYQTRTVTESPVFDERSPDIFNEDDKPLVEALLKMRAELARVQQTIDQQTQNAAERIAEIEKQRDAAISEAVYAKTRLAGQGSPSFDGEGKRSPDQDRNNDMSRRLASSLAAQAELSRRVDGLIRQVEGEKSARQLAEDTAEAAQRRVTELDSYRQQNSSDLESLRAELHETQTQARDISASHAEIKSRHDLLAIDKNELNGRLESALVESQNHTSILTTLRDAVAASTAKADMLQQRVDEERGNREGLESKLRQLRAEHEERTAELESTSGRLRDAEELAGKHAEEARTHREAVLAGLGAVTARNVDATNAADDRVATLQQQVEAANALVRENQGAADTASEKLRRAEERIAGLEAFQEQASREGLSIRKQLQTAMKENQGLATQRMELEQKVQSQMLEANALAVQHASLKDVLGERGINAADVRRSRALESPGSNFSRFSTPDLQRVRELEQQLETSLKHHDDMRAQFEEVSERDEKMKREYEDKLTALDNDHQAAVKYLRGTEKMLSKMKQELQRVKNENGDLRKKLDTGAANNTTRDIAAGNASPADWEIERDRLKQEIASVQANLSHSVSALETRLETVSQQLEVAESELTSARSAHAASQSDLAALQTSHSQSRDDLDRLRSENSRLEERARDAENKVQLLLDQVETSVDNYRRQSRISESGAPIPGLNGGAGGPTGPSGYRHSRNLSNISGHSAAGSLHSRHMSSSSFTNAHLADVLSDPNHQSNTDDSTVGAGAGRNSLALDSLASELETLRSQWETTNKNYRLSNGGSGNPGLMGDRFDFERRSSEGFGLGEMVEEEEEEDESVYSDDHETQLPGAKAPGSFPEPNQHGAGAGGATGGEASGHGLVTTTQQVSPVVNAAGAGASGSDVPDPVSPIT